MVGIELQLPQEERKVVLLVLDNSRARTLGNLRDPPLPVRKLYRQVAQACIDERATMRTHPNPSLDALSHRDVVCSVHHARPNHSTTFITGCVAYQLTCCASLNQLHPPPRSCPVSAGQGLRSRSPKPLSRLAPRAVPSSSTTTTTAQGTSAARYISLSFFCSSLGWI